MAMASLSSMTLPCTALQSQPSPLPLRCSRVSCAPPHRSPVDATLARIHDSGIIACLRADSAETAMEAARAAISAGISVLEIVVSTPGVFEVLRQLVQDHPTVFLGVGTVLNVKDAQSAVNAGAKFLMSPAMVKDIIHELQGGEILYIPGVMTPTEILSAYDIGAKIVKVYPISALGGIQYISALKKPFCHISMVASQGITIDSIGEYIDSGASAVVLSDAIFNKEAMLTKKFNAVYELAYLAAQQGNIAVEQKFLSVHMLLEEIDAERKFKVHGGKGTIAGSEQMMQSFELVFPHSSS